MEPMVVFWALTMVLALIVEIITADLVAIWFILAALVSMILATFSAPIWIQWAVFIILSAVLLIIAFKFLRKLIMKNHGNARHRFMRETKPRKIWNVLRLKHVC